MQSDPGKTTWGLGTKHSTPGSPKHCRPWRGQSCEKGHSFSSLSSQPMISPREVSHGRGVCSFPGLALQVIEALWNPAVNEGNLVSPVWLPVQEEEAKNPWPGQPWGRSPWKNGYRFTELSSHEEASHGRAGIVLPWKSGHNLHVLPPQGMVSPRESSHGRKGHSLYGLLHQGLASSGDSCNGR